VPSISVLEFLISASEKLQAVLAQRQRLGALRSFARQDPGCKVSVGRDRIAGWGFTLWEMGVV
jgi:hypothetical protein